jgi:hypothetical membrane protein
MRRLRQSAAALLLAAGTGLILLLHVLDREVDPRRHYISEYGNDTWGWLLSAALLLVGGGLLALAASVREARRSRAGVLLLQASALLLVVAAAVSTDRRGGEVATATLAGQIHGIAAIGAFVLLVLAMIAVPPRPGGGDGPYGLDRLAVWAGLAAVTPPLVVFVLAPGAHGLRQRVFLVVVFAWLIAVAVQLRSAPAAGALDRFVGRGDERPGAAS